MGVGGSGMVALAGMFLEQGGWKVRGSDLKIYAPASVELARMSVQVMEGFHEKNLHPLPDLVVVGNVISRGNPEAEALLNSQIPYTSMPQAITEHFLKNREPIVVTGTHGKTTSTSLLAWILDQAGFSPGFFIGGIPLNFGCGYRVGKGKYFVVEGDEYDTAFFEKTPKFLHYKAQHAIITSIEFDHADIYKDLDDVASQFCQFVKSLPKNGHLFACGDHELIRQVCFNRPQTKFYGTLRENEWRATHITNSKKGYSFDLSYGDQDRTHIETSLLGKHNVMNALSCISLANALGVSLDQTLRCLASFKGVRRRQEFLGEVQKIRLYYDFAHHPTAIEETLKAFLPLARTSKGKLWAVLEPRSNTLRRRVFQKILPSSLAVADRILLAPVFNKRDGLPVEESLQGSEVAKTLNKQGKVAQAMDTLEQIISTIVQESKAGDVVVFMSNGDFGNVPLRTKEAIGLQSM